MKRFLLCVLFCGLLRAQTPTDVNLSFLAQGNGTFGGPLGYYDNRATEAVTWTVAYQSDGGITGFTLAFQSATGATAPGSFSTLTPVTTSSGFGTAQYGIATYNLLSSTAGDNITAPFVQVSITGGGGTGSIRIQVYGYRTGATGGTGGGGGGGGGSGCPNPCPVEGTGNSASIVPPVYIQQTGLSAFHSNQQAVTASAVALTAETSKSVCVHALIANTINVYAGDSSVTTSTGMEIPPGQGYCWNVNNSSLIFVIASTTGASVSFTWSN